MPNRGVDARRMRVERQNTRRPAEVDRGHGSKQCDLGRGANRSGTSAQVRHSGLTSDGQTQHATSSPRPTIRALLAALEDVCSQGHIGLRFLRRSDRQVPGAVRLRDHGSGMPPNHPLQWHHPPRRCSSSGMQSPERNRIARYVYGILMTFSKEQ